MNVDYGISGDNELDKIIITWEAADDLFITEESQLVMPVFDRVSFRMADFVETSEESYAEIYFEYDYDN